MDPRVACGEAVLVQSTTRKAGWAEVHGEGNGGEDASLAPLANESRRMQSGQFPDQTASACLVASITWRPFGLPVLPERVHGFQLPIINLLCLHKSQASLQCLTTTLQRFTTWQRPCSNKFALHIETFVQNVRLPGPLESACRLRTNHESEAPGGLATVPFLDPMQASDSFMSESYTVEPSPNVRQHYPIKPVSILSVGPKRTPQLPSGSSTCESKAPARKSKGPGSRLKHAILSRILLLRACGTNSPALRALVSRLGTVRHRHGASGTLADWPPGLLESDRARGTLGDKPTEAAKCSAETNQERA